MSFYARLRSWFDLNRAVYGYRIESPSPVPSDDDQQALIASYAGWVYACANKNAVRVAAQPLKLYATTSTGESQLKCVHRAVDKKVDERVRKALPPHRQKAATVDEVLDHPLLDLLVRVNENQGQFELFELTQVSMELCGGAYWWLIPNTVGQPGQILILPPHLVKIVLGTGDKLIKSFVLGNASNEKVIPAEQIVYFRFPNPDGSVYGYPPARAAWGSILDYRAMQSYERALNNNQGVPSLFIKYSGVVEKPELARIEADWNRKIRGVNKAGRVMVGDNKFDVTPVGLSPREMSFREGRKWARTEIAGCFGIPLDLLDTEDSNRATATTANRSYEQFTIKPRLQRIADKLNERLVPQYDERLWLQYDENVPEDKEQLLEETVGLTAAGILTVNEARGRYNLPPIAAKPEEQPGEEQNQA